MEQRFKFCGIFLGQPDNWRLRRGVYAALLHVAMQGTSRTAQASPSNYQIRIN